MAAWEKRWVRIARRAGQSLSVTLPQKAALAAGIEPGCPLLVESQGLTILVRRLYLPGESQEPDHQPLEQRASPKPGNLGKNPQIRATEQEPKPLLSSKPRCS
jgi:hypothetical protein